MTSRPHGALDQDRPGGVRNKRGRIPAELDWVGRKSRELLSRRQECRLADHASFVICTDWLKAKTCVEGVDRQQPRKLYAGSIFIHLDNARSRRRSDRDCHPRGHGDHQTKLCPAPRKVDYVCRHRC